MQMDTTERDGVVVISGTGRLNMVSAPRLKAAIDEYVAAGKARLVLDLSGIDFVDSSGLGALIGGLKVARQAGGDLRISAAGEQVIAVLRLTNLDRILRPHQAVEDALRDW